MSLEAAVFGTDKFDGGSDDEHKEKKQVLKPAWIDPDNLAIVPLPTNEIDETTGEQIQPVSIHRIKFQESIGEVDTSWATFDEEESAPVIHAGDVFDAGTARLPSEKLDIVRATDLFHSKNRSNDQLAIQKGGNQGQVGGGAGIKTVIFSPIDDSAAVLDDQGTIYFVRYSAKQSIVECIMRKDQVRRYCMTYSADGSKIFVGCGRGNLQMVDVRNKNVETIRYREFHDDVTQIYCSPDNTTLAMLIGAEIVFVDVQSRSYNDKVVGSHIYRCGAYTDDGKYFIAAGEQGFGLVINTENRRQRHEFKDCDMQTIRSIATAADKVAIGTDAGILRIYDFMEILREQYPKSLYDKLNITTQIDTITFHPSGEMVVFASSGGRNRLKVLHVRSQTVFPNWPTQNTPLSFVRDVAFDRTGCFMSFATKDGLCSLWELPFYTNK